MVMILDVIQGDILNPSNPNDIIIGMNTELKEVFGIGLPFTWQIQHKQPIPLGTVFSFEFDKERRLHLIICHKIGTDGWTGADKYIRFGMDYLWHTEPSNRTFSMVKVGTGHIGKRDGANVPDIMSAIASSHLPVTLYVYTPLEKEAVEARAQTPPSTLTAYRSWNFQEGEMALAA